MLTSQKSLVSPACAARAGQQGGGANKVLPCNPSRTQPITTLQSFATRTQANRPDQTRGSSTRKRLCLGEAAIFEPGFFLFPFPPFRTDVTVPANLPAGLAFATKGGKKSFSRFWLFEPMLRVETLSSSFPRGKKEKPFLQTVGSVWPAGRIGAGQPT